MTGKIIVDPPSPHVCKGRPSSSVYELGTIWQCDDCGAFWMVKNDDSWSRIGRRTAERKIRKANPKT